MSERELIYPNYAAKVSEDGDIELRFLVPRSRFGAVRVILTADDANELYRQIDKALTASEKLLEAERV